MPYDDAARKDTALLLSQFRRPLLISHVKPDGDAIGSLLAIRQLLVTQGISATVLLFEPLPSRYAFLSDGRDELVIGDAGEAADALSNADSVVIVDTCSYNQLEPVADWLRKSPLPKLVIDHHGTRDPITNDLLIDDSAAATCLIIYELAQSAGWPIHPATATNLFVGLSTDTGWFRHSNTDARALSCAADLLSSGVKAHALYEQLYHQDSVGRVRLLGEALRTLEFHALDRIAVMTLARTAFERAQAQASDTEDVVNEPLRIVSVLVSVLLVEQADGKIRINFRSKAPGNDANRPLIDVAGLARQFDGGGHRHAAGARSMEPLHVVQAAVLKAIQTALENQKG